MDTQTGTDTRTVVAFGPDDETQVAEAASLRARVSAELTPWLGAPSARALADELRYGWDGEPEQAFALRPGPGAGGSTLAVGTIDMPTRDNLHLAWLGVTVDPDHRRRGHGTRLLEHLLALARDAGRTTVGIDVWEHAEGAREFAEHHGFVEASRAINRQQVLSDLAAETVSDLLTAATARAGDYEVLRFAGATPPDLVAQVAAVAGSINDAPMDDLDIEDEDYSPERTLAYERCQRAMNHRLYRVVARHRPSGELAGHTVVAVVGESPERAFQHDTAVAREHRGHRLGLLLKAEMVRWLAEVEPQLQTISTWNAESNDHMIHVNEALGYRVMGREVQLQCRL